MRYKIDNCHYELVKDLLSSLDSLVKNVEKENNNYEKNIIFNETWTDII